MKKKLGLLFLAAAAAFAVAPLLSLAGGSFFIDDTTSYVGIGNTTPQSRLDVSGSIYSRMVTATSTAIDWNASNVQSFTLTSSSTLTFSNGQAGGEYNLILHQDATGGHAVTWPGSVKWPNAIPPTLTSSASSSDKIHFVFDGVNYLGSFLLNYRAAGAGVCGATGGTITTSGGYTIHTFTSSGTFSVTCGSGNVKVLVIGGGGGGGGRYYGGGGGAGGYQYDTAHAVTAQSYAVTVGAGGTGGTLGNPGSQGNDSTFDTITAIGGGYGADAPGGSTGPVGGNGASGGGSGGANDGSGAASAGTGTSGQGSGGGTGSNTAGGNGYGAGGGGGGAEAVGTSPGNSDNAGAGGNGIANSISGSSITYAGGGGGGGWNGGAGGSGGGGAGASNGTSPTAGDANTGGGGGGAEGHGTNSGANGGSGIVIISYPTP